MSLSGKKVFITGADGFIGSHLTEELVRQGCKVKALSYYNSFNSWGWLDKVSPDIIQKIEVISSDVRDPQAMMAAVKGSDIVFHLAALIGIPYSYSSPDSYVDTNIKGTLNIVQAAKTFGVEKVIHTSTSEVYGTAKFVPITEEHPLNGQSPYSATKIGADQLAMSFYNSFKTPVTIVRPFNTYGPRQSARAVIPTVISQIAKGGRKIKLGSTTPTRDFSFVKDTVFGFIAAATSSQSLGEVINLGSDFEISIGDTAKLIGEVMDVQVEIETANERIRPESSEVERLWASNAKAKRLLNWSPEYSGREGLKRGLQETVKWFTNGDNLASYKHEIYNV